MFDFKNWPITGLVDGYKRSLFSMPHVTTMTANYIVAGMLTQADAANIAGQCDAWDAEKAAAEQVATLEEPPIENM